MKEKERSSELLNLYLQPGITPVDLEKTPIILISADMAGCGSTTLARSLHRHFFYQDDNRLVLVGKRVREMLGMYDEISAQGFDIVPDVLEFDRRLYMSEVDDSGAVVEGKHATSIGFSFLKERVGEDKLYLLNLTNKPLFSTMRVLRREGYTLSDVLSNPDLVLDYYKMLRMRNEHIAGQVGSVVPHGHRIDTSLFSAEEIFSYVTGQYDWIYSVQDWEIESLLDVMDELRRVRLDSSIVSIKDLSHYDYAVRRLEYLIGSRLNTMKDPYTLPDVRQEIGRALEQAVLGLLMKKVPRFGRNNEGEMIIDRDSIRWTPEYYKIAAVLPMLEKYVNDMVVLDPFGGSGGLANTLKMLCDPKEVIIGDLSYVGGKFVNGGFRYLPDMNTEMLFAIFDDLPSWYDPKFLRRKQEFATLNVLHLPFADNSVDIIVTDPPYGKNLNDGDVNFFVRVVPELLRVSRNGVLCMVPLDWLPELRDSNVQYREMAGDVSNGSSNFPICWVMIERIVDNG